MTGFLLLHFHVLFTYFLKQLSACGFTLVTKTVAQYAENAPHTGLHIPPKAAGAVQIVTGAGTAVYEFHVERISDTDSTLQGNDAGSPCTRLLNTLEIRWSFLSLLAKRSER